MMADPLTIDAPSEVQGVITRIGRTEDIKLSPDNRRLALVDFLEGRIFVFAVHIDVAGDRPKIAVTGCVALSSPSLRYPHGLCFLDDRHLVIANRKADCVVMRVPGGDSGVLEVDTTPLYRIRARRLSSAKVGSPGSLDSYRLDGRWHRILVCNNFRHTITSHRLDLNGAVRARHDGILLERGLRIPDGISISPDRKWIAISNHVDGAALLYRNDERTNRQSKASVALKGMVCPHGLRFSPDGTRLFVADAATPYMHVFERLGEWGSEEHPMKSIRMMDDRAFYIGRYDSREGGVKGLDIDTSGRVLVTTCRHRVMGFYEIDALLQKTCVPDPDDIAELSSERDHSLVRQRRHALPRERTARHLIGSSLHENQRRIVSGMRRVRLEAEMRRLLAMNMGSRESMLDPSGPVLSLTTHGPRVETVFAAIETIARGTLKPSRAILWLDQERTYARPPATLQRLKSRGLEIRLSNNFGPHTKYFPYVEQQDEFDRPLVTADDDVLYPRDWLMRLVDAHNTDPSSIHAYRLRTIRLNRRGFTPYTEWDLATSTQPSHLGFITGVSGAIYPPDFLYVLKSRGSAFRQCCPQADDIWLTVNALRAGFRIAQVGESPVLFPMIPKTQQVRLFSSNGGLGENHRQLLMTFSDRDMAKLRAYFREHPGEAER